MEKLLVDFTEQARREYGELGVSPEVLRTSLKERVCERLQAAEVTLSESALQTIVDQTNGPDLCLAIAWQAGSDDAWAHYRTHFRGKVLAAAMRQGGDEERAALLADSLPGDLLSTGSSLNRYHGRGSLSAWLAIVVRRRVIDELRKPRTEPISDSTVANTDASTGASVNPADAASSNEVASQLHSAIAPLAADLTDREATVLLLKYQQGLPQRAIARALSVSDSRVTRLLQHAFEKLAQRLRQAFPEGEPSEFPGMDSVWRELNSCRNNRQFQRGYPDSMADSEESPKQ